MVKNGVQSWHWSRGWALGYAAAARLFLIAYAVIHDYYFTVKLTDIDYSVYTDGAVHVWNGRSPYARHTFRYSPLLAFLLLPNVFFAHFGKVVFAACDLLVGWMCLQLNERLPSADGDDRSLSLVWWWWLANPLIAVVSCRGNADSLVSAATLSFLLLMKRRQWLLAAVVHGGLAVQLKIYPIIFLPAVYAHFIEEDSGEKPLTILLARSERVRGMSLLGRFWLFINAKGISFVLLSLSCFFVSSLLFYSLYGDEFVRESLLHHVTRRDTRHNFSPYFYPLYLLREDPDSSSIISLVAFLPQITLIGFFALRFGSDLPFACFLSTLSFVAFNKVCTSQYFLWYICFIPLIGSQIQMERGRLLRLIAEWLLCQGAWLLSAYFFEFLGWNSFLSMWVSSLLLLLSHVRIILFVVSAYQEKLKKE